MKRVWVFVALCCTFLCSQIVKAEEINFADNEGYYNELCLSNDLSDDDKAVCEEFSIYLMNKSSDLKNQLDEIEAKRAEIAKDIANKAKEINKYEAEIEDLQVQINKLTDEANGLEKEIAQTIAEIAIKEGEKESLMNKVKLRMDIAQDTMRLNQYLDYIMGAESFTDLLRRINSTNDLMQYDDMVRTKLINIIDELTAAKEQLEKDKERVEEVKAEAKSKQNQIILKKREAEIIREEWMKQEAEWEAQGNQIAADLESIKNEIKDMADKIGEIPASLGWTKPLPSYAYKTAGTWYYPGGGPLNGGAHLGLDLAYKKGTPVYAVANGIIISSVDGCEDNGYLGNTCGSAQGGTLGGGNQILMLARVDGMLYGIKYVHLKKGSPIANYTKVMAGDKIAELGHSGNSTGPHLHLEIYKLGDYGITEYIDNWNGNLSFGTGWGANALARTCDKVGAPCRMRPELLLGY